MTMKMKADGEKSPRSQKTGDHRRKIAKIEHLAKTPRQQAMLKVAKLHGYIKGGGWIYNSTVAKYVDPYGKWVEDIDTTIQIGQDDLEKARAIVKRVYPTHSISIVVE